MRKGGNQFVWMTVFMMGILPVHLYAERFALSPQVRSRIGSEGSENTIPVIIRLSNRFVGSDQSAERSRIDKRKSAVRMIRSLRMHDPFRRKEFLQWIRQYDPDARELWHIHAVTANLPARIVLLLEHDPYVDRITLNATIPLAVQSSPPPSSYDGWNLDAIAAERLWMRGYSGRGIVVATVDTGADLHHSVLQRSWRGGANSWFDAFGQYEQPVDSLGHGTQVMGIICGGDDLGTPVGIAPGCTWIAARIFDRNASADLAGIHRALQWILDPDNDPNTADQPDIVNNSWGLTDRPGECLPEFEEDIALLNAAGILVVFAAGNSGPAPASGVSPANYPEVLSVGAVGPVLSVSSFSSRGPGSCEGGLFPSLVAPGEDILTCDLTLGGIFPSSRTYATGTSFAAAHVSGAAAALMSSFPHATPIEIRSSLFNAAQNLGSAGPDYDSGYGFLDMEGAYQLLLASHQTADFNHNGIVDLNDLGILLEHWMQTNSGPPNWAGDLVPDGVVDLLDFSEFSRQYGGR